MTLQEDIQLLIKKQKEVNSKLMTLSKRIKQVESLTLGLALDERVKALEEKEPKEVEGHFFPSGFFDWVSETFPSDEDVGEVITEETAEEVEEEKEEVAEVEDSILEELHDLANGEE